MVTSLFANHLPGLLRLALMRDGRLEAVSFHRPDDPPGPGSRFLGQVVQVHKGIQAAFCDVGGEQNVFLDKSETPRDWFPDKTTPLESVLKEGRRLALQLKRPAFDDKLAQVTAALKFTGFRLVLIPDQNEVSFSKRYEGDDQDKARITGFLLSLTEHRVSWIVRSGAGTDAEKLRAEAESLLAQFQAVVDEPGGSVRLVEKPDPIESFLVEYGIARVNNIFIDDEAAHARLQDHLLNVAPEYAARVKLHLDETPLFDVYKVESELDHARAAKVYLKSGGWIELRQTEAMVTVDVNSGKHGKARGGLSPALRSNFEAIPEIARQIRLRNLGGLIVIDFINAREQDWRKQVDARLKQALDDDPARVDVLPTNRFGLTCLSRERRGVDLGRALQDNCRACRGSAKMDKVETCAMDIQKQLLRQAPGMEDETFLIRCGQSLADYLTKHKDLHFKALEDAFRVQVQIEKVPTMAPRAFKVDVS